MSKLLQRVGTESKKYQYDLVPVELAMSVPLTSPMMIKWTRGPRTAVSNSVSGTKGIYKWPQTKLTLIATMYSKNNKYQSKQSQLTVRQQIGKELKTIGKVDIDLASFCGANNITKEVTMKLEKCSDKSATIKFILRSTYLNLNRAQSPPGDNNIEPSMMSGISSVNQHSASENSIFTESDNKGEIASNRKYNPTQSPQSMKTPISQSTPTGAAAASPRPSPVNPFDAVEEAIEIALSPKSAAATSKSPTANNADNGLSITAPMHSSREQSESTLEGSQSHQLCELKAQQQQSIIDQLEQKLKNLEFLVQEEKRKAAQAAQVQSQLLELQTKVLNAKLEREGFLEQIEQLQKQLQSLTKKHEIYISSQNLKHSEEVTGLQAQLDSQGKSLQKKVSEQAEIIEQLKRDLARSNTEANLGSAGSAAIEGDASANEISPPPAASYSYSVNNSLIIELQAKLRDSERIQQQIQGQLESLHYDNQSLHKAVDNWRNEAKESKESLKQAEKLRNSLENDLQMKEENHKELEGKLAQFESELAQGNEKINNLNQQVQQLEGENKEFLAQINQGRTELENLLNRREAEGRRSSTELSKLNGRIIELEKELLAVQSSEVSSPVNSLQLRLSKLEEEFQEKREEYAQLQADYDRQEELNHSLRAQLDKIKDKELTALEEQFNEQMRFKGIINEKQGEIDKLKAVQAEKETEIRQFKQNSFTINRALNEFKLENSQLLDELEKVEKKLGAAEEQIKINKSLNEASALRLQELEKQNQKYKGKMAKLEEQLSQSKQSLADITGANNSTESIELAQVNEQLQAKHSELEDLREELNRTAEERSAAINSIHNLTNDRADLERKLSQTKEENFELRQSAQLREEEIGQLKLEIEGAHSKGKQKLEELNLGHKTALNLLEDRLQGLANDLEGKNKQIQELNQQIESGNDKVNELQQLLIDKQSKISQQYDKLASSKQKQYYEEEIQRLEQEKIILAKRLDNITQTLEEITQRRDVERSANEKNVLKLETQLAGLAERKLIFDRLNLEKDKNYEKLLFYEKEIELADNDLVEAKQSWQGTLAILNQQLVILEKELISSKLSAAQSAEANSNHLFQLQNLQSRTKKAEKDKEKLSELMSRFEVELVGKKVELANLIDRANTVEDENSRLKRLLEAEKKARETQHKELNKFKEQHAILIAKGSKASGGH
jgi:DNA repair exonuclease SbcCD ATPase subunit